MANCFLSHATIDKASAEEVKRALEVRRHRVFLDTDHDDGIQPGEVWAKRLQRELKIANTVIFLNSDALQESKWCHYEMLRAQELGKRIVSIDVSTGVKAHPLIDELQGIRGPSLAANAQRLVETLDAWDEPTWDPERPPYPGLFAFDQYDEAVFFGRNDDTAQLLSLVGPELPAHGHTILMMGPSGVGKSSLLRAGLSPRLARHGGWRVVGPFSPGRDPCRELHSLLDIDDPGRRGTLLERGGRVVRQLQRPGRLLVVIDQAEELVQPDIDQTSRERLVTELREAATDRSPVTTVISFREDRLDEMKRILPAFFETGLTPTQVVNRLPQSRLAELVEGPARVAGLDLEPGLVGRLMEEATGDHDDKLHALPLIAFTLGEMYRRAAASGRYELTQRDYEEAGRFEGAIRKAARQLESNLSASELAAIDTLLPKLVTVAEDGAVGARTVLLKDLNPAEVGVSRKLGDKRLLNISQAQDDTDAAARLVHDRLITDWPRIKAIVDTRGEDLRLLSRLRRQADEFADKQREVLTADATSDAYECLKGQPETSDLDSIRAYVDASRTAHRRRRWSRRSVLGVIVVLAVVAVGFGINSRSAEELARTKAATDRALALLANGKYAEAARAAHESLTLRWTDEAEDALRLALAPLGNTRLLSTAALFAVEVAFSPDGTRLAAAGYEGTAILWDVASGEPSTTLNPGSGPVVEVAFSPDGTAVATGGGSNGSPVIVWDVTSGQRRSTMKSNQIVTGLEFSPDGTVLAISHYDDGIVILSDVASGQPRTTLKAHSLRVNGIAFSPDGTRLATASEDGTAVVWDVASGQTRTKLEAHRRPVNGVAFSPDGIRVATASADGTAIVWDVATSQPVTTLDAGTGPVIEVAFSPDGTGLATVSADGTAVMWDVNGSKIRATLNSRAGNVRGAAFSPDGTKLAMASLDAGVIVWDVAAVQLRSARSILTGHSGHVTGVAFSPDGTRLATASDDWTAIVWDVASGEPVVTLNARGPVHAVAFGADGTTLATADDDGTAIVWDVASGRPISTLNARAGPVYDMAFSPDGTKLATANDDGTAIVWDVASGQTLTTLTVSPFPVSGVSFSPDGAQLATASGDEETIVWDLANGQRLTTLKMDDSAIGVAFSPDGTRLATANGDWTAIVWDLATGQPLTTSKLGNSVTGVTFSPDGTKLAIAVASDEATVWDIAGGHAVTTLKARTGGMSGVAFSPDGTRLATAGDDGTAIIWTAEDLLSRGELDKRAKRLLG